jgi:hypothetical protein
MKKIKKKWLIHAVGGILLMGFGLSLLGEATILKMREVPWLNWFATGTIALVLVFGGLSIFGQAVVYKVALFQKQPKKKRN